MAYNKELRICIKFRFNVGKIVSETYEMLLERFSSRRHVERKPLNGKLMT